MNPLENTSTSDDHRLPKKFLGDPFKSGIHRLPEEILIMIIAGLPLKDGKNSRLVCKRWSDVNNINQISKKEKFVCSKSHDFDLVLQTIQNSGRKILNIEFSHVNFCVNNRKRLIKFWNTCGWRIESLSFTECYFTQLVLAFVILYCDKIRYLSIKTYLDFSAPIQELIPTTALKALKKMNIRREHLRSFKLITVDHRLLTFDFLKGLLAIHPNLDELILLEFSLTSTELKKLLQDESTFADKFPRLLLEKILVTKHYS